MNKYLKIGFVAIAILALILIPTYCCFNQPKQPQTQNNTQQYISETTDNILLKEIAKDKRILEVKYDSLLKVKLRFIKGKDRVKLFIILNQILYLRVRNLTRNTYMEKMLM